MTITQVRVLTSDLPQYERSIATGDGVTVEFQVEQYPVIDGSAKVYVNSTLQTESTDYDLDTEVGLVTFTTPPDPGDAIVVTYRHALLSDAQVQALIDLEPNVFLAAAFALDTIASSEVLIQKKITLLDLTTDGPAEAKALREHAKALRDRVAADLLLEDAGAFEIAEMILTGDGEREYLINQALRGRL